MLHAAEAAGKIADDIVRHKAVHGGDGRHVVLYVMDTGDLDVRRGHDDPLPRRAAADDVLPPQEHAVPRLGLPAEQAAAAHSAGRLLGCDSVVGVENRDIAGALMPEDVLLGGHIFRHVPVHIQMVRRQIGHHGNVGAALHGHQLEAGQLQHRIVLRSHPIRITQQRMADVAAQPHRLAGGLQQLGNDRGGRGLTVRAGNGDDGTRADLKERLHLAGQHAAAGNSGGDLGHIGPQTRCAEDHVLMQPLQIVGTKAQRTAAALQLVGQRPHLLPRPLVADGDGDAVLQQQPHQRRIADADAQHRHRFIS